MYPLDKIVLPPVLDSDWSDLPARSQRYVRNIANCGAEVEHPDHEVMLNSGRWKEAVQAYLATITFADAQVGRGLAAVDRGAHRDNTVGVLMGDHGWHLGEKKHWHKFTLWEEAKRTPMIWKAPGVTASGGVCGHSIDRMAPLPSLMELCGIPIPNHVEGVSIQPLLRNPALDWTRPAVTTAAENGHAIRSEAWRYISYGDHTEELYDETKDPPELTNVSGWPEHARVKEGLAGWLLKLNRPTRPASPSAKNSVP